MIYHYRNGTDKPLVQFVLMPDEIEHGIDPKQKAAQIAYMYGCSVFKNGKVVTVNWNKEFELFDEKQKLMEEFTVTLKEESFVTFEITEKDNEPKIKTDQNSKA